MVDIKLVDSFTTEFFSLIPKQRKLINDLMNGGIINSYSLSIDRSKLWIIMETFNEREVMDVLSRFPLIKFMHPEIIELAFHDGIYSGFPHLSLN